MPDVATSDLRAMGCAARVSVVGGDPSLRGVARRRLESLEARWTRFRPDSELVRLCAHPDVPVVVSADTYLLVERAVAAWHATGGRFDPTVHDAVVALGYDRTFDEVRGGPPVPPVTAPGCVGIVLDPVVRAVTVPRGVRLDAGGIGKGLAADLVVEELLAAGAQGALVEIGGDLRVAGDAPGGAGWEIAIEDPLDAARELGRVLLDDAGVATSSTTRRTWIRDDGVVVHHLVDPRTGVASDSDVLAVTVFADTAWRAEVLAKAAFLAGLGGAGAVIDAAESAAAIVVARDGSLQRAGSVVVEAA